MRRTQTPGRLLHSRISLDRAALGGASAALKRRWPNFLLHKLDQVQGVEARPIQTFLLADWSTNANFVPSRVGTPQIGFGVSLRTLA
jgi:hypothetical protein